MGIPSQCGKVIDERRCILEYNHDGPHLKYVPPARSVAQEAEKPQLFWEGPDEDGDLWVYLRPVPGWGPDGVMGHGETVLHALHCLGAVVVESTAEGCEYCAEPATPPPALPQDAGGDAIDEITRLKSKQAALLALVTRWEKEAEKLRESAREDRDRSSVGLAQPKEQAAFHMERCAGHLLAELEKRT